MEHSIPALLIASIMIFAGVLLADVTTSSVDNVNQGWREMETIAEERLGTDLTVVSTQVNLSGAEVIAVVRNDGRTTINDFELMDMIVNYDGADLQRHSAWLPYSDAIIQPDNSWTVTGIATDYHNPGLLDTGEEMTLRITLNPAALIAPNRWLVLSTENGVAYTVYF